MSADHSCTPRKLLELTIGSCGLLSTWWCSAYCYHLTARRLCVQISQSTGTSLCGVVCFLGPLQVLQLPHTVQRHAWYVNWSFQLVIVLLLPSRDRVQSYIILHLALYGKLKQNTSMTPCSQGRRICSPNSWFIDFVFWIDVRVKKRKIMLIPQRKFTAKYKVQTRNLFAVRKNANHCITIAAV